VEVIRVIGRFILGLGERALILIGAVVLGFGVPVFWLWVAARLYGKTGAVNGSVAAFIFVAILLTYCAILLAASWLRGRLGYGEQEAQQIKRAVWNRSVRDVEYHPGQKNADFVERLFVSTTIVVGIAFIIWFGFFAGAPFA
jgi:multisubunit Na+/H+ antiporter MnhC subunit